MRSRSLVDRRCLRTLFVAVASLFVLTSVVAHAQTYKLLYNFTGGADGLQPVGLPVLDSLGNLYGVTSRGGDPSCSVFSVGCGVVFELKADGTFVVLHAFHGGTDGAEPEAGLIRDSHGNLFGTTSRGGDPSCAFGEGKGCGTIFKISPNGHETILHSLNGLNEGAFPVAPLFRDALGNLWGTAQFQGFMGNPVCDGGCGTIFKLDSQNRFSVYPFKGQPSGSWPTAGFTPGPGGEFYSTTRFGGSKDNGSVYKFSTTGQISVLHSFNLKAHEPANPYAPLLISAGKIYGLAGPVGQFSGGTLYQIDQTGFSIVFNFNQAEPPGGNVLRDPDGNFYGQTGLFLDSIITELFKLDTTGNLSVLHTFEGFPNDGTGSDGLLWDGHGSFYGLTFQGGTTDAGTIFRFTP